MKLTESIKNIKLDRMVIFTFFSGLVTTVFLANIHGFLAVVKPVRADVLIIESWISPDAVYSTDSLLLSDYTQCIIVGDASDRRSKEEMRKTVQKMIDEQNADSVQVIQLSIKSNGHPKTKSYALKVQQWLLERKMVPVGCNVLSEGAHARKSHIVFKRYLKSIAPVGVYAAPPSKYNSKRWIFSFNGWAWVILDSIKTTRAYIFGY